MTCTITILAVAGASSPKTILVGTRAADGTAAYYSFADATNITAELFADGVSAFEADSDTDAGVFDYNNGSGELVVDFGLLTGITADDYVVRIKKHTVATPQGIILDRGDTYTCNLTVTA